MEIKWEECDVGHFGPGVRAHVDVAAGSWELHVYPYVKREGQPVHSFVARITAPRYASSASFVIHASSLEDGKERAEKAFPVVRNLAEMFPQYEKVKI